MSKTIGEQLESLSPSFKLRRTSVRPVSQVALTIFSKKHPDLFNETVTTVLKWLNRRSGKTLPPEAWAGRSFELDDVGAQRTAAVRLSNPEYWAARLDDADRDVAQRYWTTEVGVVAQNEKMLKFACRLLCVTRGADVAYQPSIPGLVRQVVANGDVWADGRNLSEEPWLIETEADVEDLIGLLASPKRRQDVHVVSLPEGSVSITEAALPAGKLHLAMLGAAHVAVITGPASYHLTDRVGKHFSVFHSAVRTYRPGFDPEVDDPFAHPLVLPHWLDSWPARYLATFEDYLVGQALRRTVSDPDLERSLPPFTQIKEIAAAQRFETARESGASDKELYELTRLELEEAKANFEEQKSYYESLLAEQDTEVKEAREAVRDLTAQNNALKARQQHLMARVARVDMAEPMQVEIPADLQLLREWSDQHLAGSVVILSRAFGGAKKSRLLDTALVYNALLLLRDYYVPMRVEGGLERKAAYETRCRELGIEETASFAGTRFGEYEEEYVVRYKGRRQLLDRHLKKGNDREERTCFRLYFFWDDDDQQVVVGWLPSHLTTRLT